MMVQAGFSLSFAMLLILDGDFGTAGLMAGGVGKAPLEGLLAFGVAAGVSFIPGLHNSAGLIILGGAVIFWGLEFVAFAPYAHLIRLGITMLGGFVGAGLVFAADWLLKTQM